MIGLIFAVIALGLLYALPQPESFIVGAGLLVFFMLGGHL